MLFGDAAAEALLLPAGDDGFFALPSLLAADDVDFAAAPLAEVEDADDADDEEDELEDDDDDEEGGALGS